MALINTKETDEDGDHVTDFHFPSSPRALIIFTRNPELGKCKTRLAATVGDESALRVYRFLLAHTAKITAGLQVDKMVFYSDAVHKNDTWDDSVYTKKIQNGETLGDRMNNAFTEVFNAGYSQAIVIGSDMYDLSQKDLEKAFAALDENEVVIGPAEDGGYYLLGMKEPHPSLFVNKAWGTATVLADTLADLSDDFVALLEERNDVDYYSDIKDIPAFQEILGAQFKV